MITTIFILFVFFQLKHFIADYPLQTEYMLGKFKSGKQFIMPLLAHTSIHALFTYSIAIFFVNIPTAIGLALFDLVIHFIMDRIKASPRYLGRYKPLTSETYFTATATQKRHNNYFWYSLGFDQMVHHLTNYAIIYWLIKGLQ